MSKENFVNIISKHGFLNIEPDSSIDIVEEMCFQGSCWFMTRYHYWEFLGGMNSHGYGTFSQEPQEIGLKTWLGGGAIKVNKKTNSSCK